MAPTVQPGRPDERDRRRHGAERRSELVCKVKYNNTLPDIPFDPKFITYPFDTNRFVQYNPTSLEKNYKHDLLTEHDLGVQIDLICPDTYEPTGESLDIEDERLLEEEVLAPQDSKRSRHHNRNVCWLRKTEYISTEYNRFQLSANQAESKLGFNLKKHFKEEDLYKDRESQLKAISDTFEAAKTPITKHYSKPGVTPLDILPVYPDFEMWRHPCAQVIFDSDPAPKYRKTPAQQEEMSQAMIRGMVDESGDQFVAYFLPTEETLQKRKRDAEDGIPYLEGDEFDYTLAREYNWNVKNKASKGYEENYFFVLRDDGVYYNELETRVRLNKRRKIGGAAAPMSNSRLIVKHREVNDQEVAAEEARLMMLEPPGEEEPEPEEDDLMMGMNGDVDAQSDAGSHKSRSSRSSRGSRRSGSGSRSRSGSRSGSGSRSRSRSRSGSRSGSGSRSRSRSRSGSRSGSGSRSRSRSRSGSRSHSGSRSRSRSRSGSRSASRSRSRSRSRSGSRNRSRSRSASESGSGSESDVEQQHKRDEEEIFGSDSDED